MLDTIDYSVKHFFKHILKLDLSSANSVCEQKYFVSKIALGVGEKEYDCYLALPCECLKFLYEKWLNQVALDEEFCAETVSENAKDLSKEIINQLIGYAKKLIADYESECAISVPEFCGVKGLSEVSNMHKFCYKLAGFDIFLGIVCKSEF